MKAHGVLGPLTLAACSVIPLSLPTASWAQVWQVGGATLHMEGNGYANILQCNGPLVFGTFSDLRTSLLTNFGGASYGQRWADWCFDNCPPPFPGPEKTSDAQGIGQVLVFGDLTQRITLRWEAHAYTDFNGPDDMHDVTCASSIGVPNLGGPIPPSDGFVVTLNTQGAPNGFPLTVYYNWRMRSWGENNQEVPGQAPAGDDHAYAKNLRLDVGVNEYLQGHFDWDLFNPVRGTDLELKDQSGSFVLLAGTPLTVRVRGDLWAEIHTPPQGVLPPEDRASAHLRGELRLWLDVPPPPSPPYGLPGLPPSLLDFSVDIGGDAELSDDPVRGAERVFDPGDVYFWGGPPLPNPGGADGYRDDLAIWHGFFDPFPAPPDLVNVAPVCTGILPPPSNMFDLDGHDATDVDLSLVIPEFVPLAAPVRRSGLVSSCIWPAEFLLISFEDDDLNPYTVCDVPAVTPSSMGLTHGSGTAFDEVLGLVVSPYTTPSAPLLLYPLANEQTVHISMLPDPAPGHEEWDDDVDSLDALPSQGGCQYAYFGADHEAAYALDPQHGNLSSLDPGGVYEIMGAGLPPKKIVDPAIHLGLVPGVDLADFEFVWINDSTLPAAPPTLALIFAVHANDPTTPQDESSGLDPRMIYWSFMTGTSSPYLISPLPDRVDAITAFDRDLSTPNPPPSGWCAGDASHDHLVTFADITAVLANFGQIYPPGAMGIGDANCDGPVNFTDITVVLANFGHTCP